MSIKWCPCHDLRCWSCKEFCRSYCDVLYKSETLYNFFYFTCHRCRGEHVLFVHCQVLTNVISGVWKSFFVSWEDVPVEKVVVWVADTLTQSDQVNWVLLDLPENSKIHNWCFLLKLRLSYFSFRSLQWLPSGQSARSEDQWLHCRSHSSFAKAADQHLPS